MKSVHRGRIRKGSALVLFSVNKKSVDERNTKITNTMEMVSKREVRLLKGILLAVLAVLAEIVKETNKDE